MKSKQEVKEIIKRDRYLFGNFEQPFLVIAYISGIEPDFPVGDAFEIVQELRKEARSEATVK